MGLFLLAGVAAADTIDLSASTITSGSTGWLVANGVDHATITVTVKSPTGPVSGAQVSFSVSDPALGTLSPTTPVVTGSDGTASAQFTTGLKSGTAVITAQIVAESGGDSSYRTLTLSRNIDHDTLQNAVFTSAGQVPAGSVTPLVVTVTDRWGNRADNKNPAESHLVTLQMNGDGGSGLWDGTAYVTAVSLPTNAEGNVSVNVRVSTNVGNNPIVLEPVGLITSPIPTSIEGVAGTPVSMTQTVTPVSAASCSSLTSCPADGDHPFNLYYTVLDRYNNPVKGTVVGINATLDGTAVGSPYSVTTDSSGIAFVQFTQEVMGTYTLTARSSGNASIACTNPAATGYCSQNLEYYPTAPVDMQMVVSPEVMVSRDVNASSQATLMARVMDAKGNAVKTYQGVPMNVSFVVNHPDTFPDAPSGSPYVETTASSLSATKANVGDDGFATVQFYPGAFASYGQTGYNATATGQVTVTATWINPQGTPVTRTGTLVWKNYPYLSLISSASPANPKVGDNLTVTVRINGDGAALHPKPIAVVLCIDRSGSMLYDNPDRMYSIREAAKSFVDAMSPQDSVALVTFGQKGTISRAGYSSGISNYEINNVYLTPKTYADYATVDVGLTSLNPTVNPNAVTNLKNALDGIVPDYATPMREALKDSIQVLPASSTGTVQAVVLLTDGDYNYYGDPLARGHGYTGYGPSSYGDLDTDYTQYSGVSNQNMALYAKDRGVRIYSIAYGSSISSGGAGTLSTLATSSGGKYYTASAANIATVYRQIAGELNEQAGGNTTVSLNFGTISVVNVSSNADIGNYLDYRYAPPISTNIYMFNTSPNGATHDYYKYTRDDTLNWSSGKKLSFNVGTVKLNDTWQATMMFRLTQNGTLILFGPDHCSAVSFTDASTGKTTSGCIPSLLVQVRNSSGATGLGSNSLFVDQMQFIDSGHADTGIVRLKWNTTYTGPTAGDGFVGETVQYRSTSGTGWIRYSDLSSKPGPIAAPGVPDTLDIDTSGWAPGTYLIEVYAVADSAPDSYATLTYTKNPSSGSYIQLE